LRYTNTIENINVQKQNPDTRAGAGAMLWKKRALELELHSWKPRALDWSWIHVHDKNSKARTVSSLWQCSSPACDDHFIISLAASCCWAISGFCVTLCYYSLFEITCDYLL